MAKRKAETNGHANGSSSKKQRPTSVISTEDAQKAFRKGLFDKKVLKEYTNQYADSEPYKHAVIQGLMDDSLLRNVRTEVRENVHFTPKETDIYKIHQSGDLANLDGLEDDALKKLPSLLKLRDALYSPAFREYVATVTNSGKLSGKKTDMAINVYTPGCHLLCHDDVIGSRRVSYILYLTDPDIPWQAEWGGALRLFPTTEHVEDGEVTRTPSPDVTKVIPPAWNQLSFFAVQPGLSFHDVEEVYHASSPEELEKQGGRVRMAISGWFHIPQEGEDGYEEGLEEKLAEKSSLVQLQGKADAYDFPKEQRVPVPQRPEDSDEIELEEGDFEFLLRYLTPMYLTPDTMERVSEHFAEEQCITLDNILSKKFSAKIREYIEAQDGTPITSSENTGDWKVARPPHKHRFLYQQENIDGKEVDVEKMNPLQELLDVFLPSRQFRQWLEMATECEIESHDLLARRFRKGSDYALATAHEGKPRLEISVGLTPTDGWIVDEEDFDDEEELEDEEENGDEEKAGKKDKGKGKGKANDVSAAEKAAEKAAARARAMEKAAQEEPEDDVGGHEVYMAGDEEDDNEDAAIYKTSADEEEDPVLFTVPASWNKMSIVLRDSGALKFMKYVSQKAKGDRWDIQGVFDVAEPEEGEEGEEGGGESGGEGEEDDEDEDEDEDEGASDLEKTFNGFSDEEGG